MDKLTRRQSDVLTYVKSYIASHGYPPTVREIGSAIGVNSPATVQAHLECLSEKGFIRKEGTKNRTIEVLVDNEYIKKNDNVIQIPLLGKITAGSPIEAIERPNEFLSIPTFLVPKNKEVFSLNVSGNSMINAGILDGDIVIVEKRNTARNGEIIVAMTEDNEVTLKTFYKEKDHIRLQPENDTMNPIILNNVIILGKAIGLYRSF
ncbi:MAG: transcriptional repressor LexA [Bacilli bacterium]|nr:transcriptional repressor LexA [Bacilli bacterium]